MRRIDGHGPAGRSRRARRPESRARTRDDDEAVRAERRLRAVLAALVLTLLAAASLSAQTTAPEQLTLDEALRLAREHNPNFLSTRNDQAAADWQLREAYGQFLPSATASGSMTYTEAGVQRFGTVELATQTTDWYSSFYGLNLNWTLNGNTLFGVSNARAGQRATAARIDAAEFTLESAVTLQYMATLRARDAVDVARRQLDRAAENLEIVRTRVEVGAAAGTEGKQAEVDHGRARVALIQAEQSLHSQKLLLMERLGVTMGDDLELVSSFDVFDPGWEPSELLSYALESHPSLHAFRAQERASTAQVRQARSAYFPTVSLSTGFRGNTLQALSEEFLITQAEGSREAQFESCRRWTILQETAGRPLPGIDLSGGCGSPELSAAQRDAVLARNDVFPFDFTKIPLSVSLQVSIPVFNGFARQRQVEQAEAAAEDAHQSMRAEELRLRTAVTQAHNDLVAAHEVVEIEGRNRELAQERLEMARQRYAIGASPSQGTGVAGSTYLELLDALSSVATAERDYLDATYDFHLALAQLEAATGRKLRPADSGGDAQ